MLRLTPTLRPLFEVPALLGRRFMELPVSILAMRRMEDENRRLKHLVAELTLDNQALKGVLSKKW